MAEGRMIFISGGVRSGKSAYAERLIRSAEANRRVYLASGQPHDAEMEERIRRHRTDRAKDGWLTMEQPRSIEKAVGFLKDGDAVLWDCVTTWLANELYEGWEQGRPCSGLPGCMEQKWEKLQRTVRLIRGRAELFIVVSNEVMDDFVRDEPYQEWLGRIHQWLVAEANAAVEMESGIAFKRK